MSSIPNDRFGRLAALRPARKRAPIEPQLDRETPTDAGELARLLGATVGRNRYGEHLSVRRWHSSPEECPLDPAALRFLMPLGAEPSAATSKTLNDPSQWLFLDTETTGLAGGTGTYAFLVGLAWWDAGGLQVEQLFMRDHGEEHSLLLELSRRMAERRVLVTFNGKSFDWPLLETRFLMTRAIAPENPAVHLDLLHPARQLWRPRLGSVRLTELERRVLAPDGIAWTRGDDIDSALIPQIYFDYLRGGAAEPLAGVFRHNEMDLRGLAALAGKVLGILARPESLADTGDAALDLYGASRLFHRRGDAVRSRSLCERALTAGLPHAIERTARRDLALAARRERDFSRAAALWEEILRGPASGEGRQVRAVCEAYEQLAIHYEHRTREPRRAAAFARDAMAAVRKASQFGTIPSAERRKLLARWEHRLARLERKLRSRPSNRVLTVTPKGPGESNPA
jgi:uncharacterized protein YprB with RNaseH-like and TPR domain